MNASKEEARKAIEAFDRITTQLREVEVWRKDVELIYEFLKKAEKKLPSEASYAKASASKMKGRGFFPPETDKQP